MSISICAQCISRLRLSSQPTRSLPLVTLTSISSFHRSAIQNATPPKKKPAVAGKQPVKTRVAKSAKIKKKTKDRPKPPPVGERKAARKRIVLSNTNALEVMGMPNMNAQSFANQENLGQMLGLDGTLLDQLRDVKAFKTTQNWNMFRRPATLVREETLTIGQEVKAITPDAKSQGGTPKLVRHLVAGDRLAGKSILLLQAMCMAYLNQWIVINIPEGQEYTYNQSSYAPLPQAENSSEEQIYIQPHLTSELLTRLAYSNKVMLKVLKLNHKLPTSIQVDKKPSTLHDLALIGAEEPTQAWAVWQAVWAELTVPGSGPNSSARPPLLIAVDGINHWMGLTKYRSAEFNFIHAQQFSLIRQFTSLLFNGTSTLVGESGAKNEKSSDKVRAPSLAIPQGGLILGATTGSNAPTLPSFDLLLSQLRAQKSSTKPSDLTFPLPRPYSKPAPRVLELFNSAITEKPNSTFNLMNLKGLSKMESKGLLEYFAKSGLFQEKITETVVGEKWSLSGGGVVGELAKLGKRLRV